jgi:hypothetical protein
MYRPARLVPVVIVRDIQPVVGITAPDQTLSKQEDPVFLHVSHSTGPFSVMYAVLNTAPTSVL